MGFSAKAIFVKLAYAAAPVEAVTLLALRMAFSLPVFLWIGLRESRNAPPLTRSDWAATVVLGLDGVVVAAMQANDWDASGEVKATVGKPR